MAESWDGRWYGMAIGSETDSSIKVGDRIVFFGGTHHRRGQVKWLGPLEDISNDLVAGIELDKRYGTNDGSWGQKRFFDCKRKHGIFVDVNALIKEEVYFEAFKESDSSDLEIVSDDDDDGIAAAAAKVVINGEEKMNGRMADDMSAMGNSSADYDNCELMARLELALCDGEELLAAEMAKKLARSKVKCVVRPATDGGFARNEPKPGVIPNKVGIPTLMVKVKVEHEDAEYGSIEVPMGYSIEELKEKIQRENKIDADRQMWHINGAILLDDESFIIDSDDLRPVLVVRSNSPVRKRKNAAIDEATTSKKLKWDCEKCTFCNEPTTLTCSMCNTRWPENFEGPPALRNQYIKLVAQEKWLKAKHEKDLMKKFKEYEKLSMHQLVINPQEFECDICMSTTEKGMGVILQNCLHSFCANCLKETIRNSEEIPVQCPYAGEYYCNSTMQEREIKQLLSEEEFQKYTNRLMAKAAAGMRNTFHCKTPDCGGWCEYEYGAQTYTCEVCGKTSCITCRAIHVPLSCRQYQDWLKSEEGTNEDARKTRKAVVKMLKRGTAMMCPGCDITIMKIDGCDGMVCSQCKIAICWATKGPRWGPGGQGDLTGGCRCNVGGVRCHPNCRNCH